MKIFSQTSNLAFPRSKRTALARVACLAVAAFAFVGLSSANAAVYLDDTFAGNTGASVSTSVNATISLSSGLITYNAYQGVVSGLNSTLTLSDSATAGYGGGPGLVQATTDAQAVSYGGFYTPNGVTISEWAPGSITAAELATLQVSYQFTLVNAYGNGLACMPEYLGATGSGGLTFIYTSQNSGNSGGNFQSVVFDFSSLTPTQLNNLAAGMNAMNGGLGTDTLQFYNTGDWGSGNLAAPSSVTWSNLKIETVPEPGTWAMMAGSFGMLLGFQRMRRSRK